MYVLIQKFDIACLFDFMMHNLIQVGFVSAGTVFSGFL